MMKIFNKKILTVFALIFVMCALLCVSASAATHSITTSEDSLGITLENDHVILSYNASGVVTQYTFKDDGVNYLGSGGHIAYLIGGFYDYYPTSLAVTEIDSDRAFVTVTFTNGVALDFTIDVYDDFFVFELLDKVPESCETIVMGGVKLNSSYTADCGFASFAYSMHYNTLMDAYPSTYETIKNLICKAHSELDNGSRGARFAMVGCPEEDYYDVLRFIVQFVSDPDVSAATTMGGAFAKTEEVMDKAVRDYVIVGNLLTDEQIRFFLSYNATQFDYQHGDNTFLQGSMDFADEVGGDAEGFKTNVTDRIKKIAKEEGLDALTGLHTYAYYISPNNTELLSQPEVVRQLEIFEDEIYTLYRDISEVETLIPTFEDVSGFDLEQAFFKYSSKYIRIDDEIMKVNSVSGNNFTVARGQCGTTAASHRKGADIYHLGGLFGMLCPDLESELFVDIAKYTAQAYVKGGFEMIYVDALDGLNRHTEHVTYYQGYFIANIMKEINRLRNEEGYTDVPDPIFEYSSFGTSVWNARTRTGAMDTFSRGHKYAVGAHTTSNVANKYNYTSNIGWYALFNTESTYPYITQTQHFDVIDLLGKNIIAHNMGYSYTEFSQAELDAYPLHKANADLLVKYLKLRDSRYFTDEVISTISGYFDEWKLIEENGEYGFEHRDYSELKFNDIATDTPTASNPFDAQVPALIRIQSLLTDDANDNSAVVVADFDETKEISETITDGGWTSKIKNVSLTTYKSAIVRIIGNGKGGQILIKMVAQNDDTTECYRVIDVDFTGERDVVIAEWDNGVFTDNFTNSMSYSFARNTDTDMGTLSVAYSGDMDGVFIDTVTLTKATYSSIVNPGVSYNGSTITFNTTITSGEFVEFDGTKAYHYTAIGTPTEITYTSTGTLTAPKGDFEVTATGTGAKGLVNRERVTIGFRGEKVFNDLSNEAVSEIVVKNNPQKTDYVVGETLDITGLTIFEKMNTGRRNDVESGFTVEEITFTEAGIHKIPVTYNGFTTTFTVVAVDIAPERLEIATEADKVSFYAGETIDTAGLALTLTYNNGDVETVTEGFILSDTVFETTGTHTLTVYYKGLSVSYEVNIATPKLISIAVTTLPIKTTYVEGELFSTVGMVVTGTYSAGITAEITDYTYTPNGALTTDTDCIVIMKNGLVTECGITVTEKTDDVTFTLGADSTTALPGNEVVVTLRTESGTIDAVESLEFVISYDTDILTYVDGSALADLPDGWEIWETVDAENGTLKLVLVDEGDTAQAVSLTGFEMNLTFATSASASNGTVSTLSITDVAASDASLSYPQAADSTFDITLDSKITLKASSDYVIDREAGVVYISKAETTQEEFFANFTSTLSLSSTSSAFVGTGRTVSLKDADGEVLDSLTVVLRGDCNSNGKIDTTDYSFIKKAYLGEAQITAARSLAADVNGNGYIDTNDYMQVKRHYEGKINIFD